MKIILACAALALATVAQSQTTPAAFGTYQKPFSADSLWNSYPVNPVFDNSYVIPDSQKGYDPVIKRGEYALGIFEAKSTDTAMVIYPRTSSGVWDPDGETRHPTITIPRWPAATVGATGSDGHADIIDPIGNKVYSLWQLKKNTSGQWTAESVAWAPLNGSGWGNPAHYQQGSRAAGVPASAGMIRSAEINDNKPMYEHALAMSLDFSALTPAPNHFVYPATSGDRTIVGQPNTGQIAQGARVMLPPSFDLSKITDARLLKVARTLKTYGAYVVDRNGDTPFAIYVENGDVPWSAVFPKSQLFLIKNSLRRVLSQERHINGLGQTRVVESAVNLLSLRGTWTRVSGVDAPGVYDTFRQALAWGTTTKYLKQTNYSYRAFSAHPNPFPTAPNQYRLSVESIGGARMSMTIMVNGTQHSVTPMLGNGQSHAVVWPAGGKALFTAEKYPGAPAYVRARLVQLPPGQ